MESYLLKRFQFKSGASTIELENIEQQYPTTIEVEYIEQCLNLYYCEKMMTYNRL